MIVIKPFLRAALAAAATAVLVAVPLQPAVAAADGLEFSRDAISWQTTAPASVFEGDVVLAPGGAQTATWYIRNGHGERARISAVITDVTWSSALAAEMFELAAKDGTGGGFAAQPIGTIGACTAAIEDRILQPGEIVGVTVTVGIPASISGTTGFDESMGFALALSLADVTAPVGADGCPVDPLVIPGNQTSTSPARGGAPGTFTGAGPGSGADIVIEDPGVDEDGFAVIADDTPAPVEWVQCGLRAMAAAAGAAAPTCRDFGLADGAAFMLGMIFLIAAIIWFIILWRKKHRDEEEEEHLVQGGQLA